MSLLRNSVITLLIVLLGALWVYLHPSEERAAFELNDSQQSKSKLLALVVSRTGHGSNVGEAVEHGVRHFLSELKADPEFEQIGLVTFDDQSNPEEAKRIAEKIAADKRFVAVIGHTDNDTTTVAAPVYSTANIPMITPSADAYQITDDSNWTFSTIMSDKEQGEFAAFYVEHALEGNHVVMLAHEANLKTELIKQFHDTAAAEGITVVDYTVSDHEGHLRDNESSDLVKSIKTNNPDVVFLSLNADHTEDMLIALKDAGYKKRIVANGPVGTPYFSRRFKDMHKEQVSPGYYTNGVIVPVPFILDIANNLAHQENELYHDQYGHDMSWPFAFGYDTAKVVTEALHRAHQKKV